MDIVVSGKRINLYEKFVSADSLDLKPENNIFLDKSEFYSDLKQKVVLNNDSQNLSFYTKH